MNVNNPNISGISATALSPDKDTNPLASNISKVTSKPAYSFANLGNAGGSGGGSGYGGGGGYGAEGGAKKSAASAALYGKAAGVLKVARNAFEFDVSLCDRMHSYHLSMLLFLFYSGTRICEWRVIFWHLTVIFTVSSSLFHDTVFSLFSLLHNENI